MAHEAHRWQVEDQAPFATNIVQAAPAKKEQCAIIDLNAASAEELDALPQLKGHGFEIVRYREDRGCFRAVRHWRKSPA